MTPEDWARVKQVFEGALERHSIERARYLDETCAGNPALRAEVASLLNAHAGAAGFIEAPAYEVDPGLLFAPETQTDVEGRVIGPYIIRREIGRGGMGIVYLADDTRLSRRVALKAVAPAVGADPRGRERMRHEARAAAALSHPNIATVYALEEIGEELYLACEYVSGPTLRTLLAQGPMPLAQVIDVAGQLARALAAAHAQGVVHRDLKPENVLRTAAGVVKVLDFGLARVEGSTDTRLTRTDTLAGTPAYMAPEQIRGDAVDFRSDLFAFGLVVYEMASGANPFEADTVTATIARILQDSPAPLSHVSPSGSPALDRIVATCLRKDPRERYSSTARLVADLERLERADAEGIWPAAERETVARQWWWAFHQVAVAAAYVLMLYPAWRVRPWLPPPWGMLFLSTTLVCAAVAATARLHLWFTARSYPVELAAQRARAAPLTRWSDVVFALSLLIAGLAIGGDHAEVAMLLVAVAIVAAVASFLIEPTTARAAFGDASTDGPRG